MNDNLKHIRELEPISRRLDPSPDERARMTEKIVRYASDFLDRIHEIPAYNAHTDEGIGVYDSPISEDPVDIDAALDTVRDHVDSPSLNPASGGHLGYIPGGGLYPAALGDYLADVTNRFSGIYFASPGAVRMEHMLVRWMTDLAGYPESAGGDLTSGGSIANLVAIVTARTAHELKARDFDKVVVYLSPHAHHCVDKALRIAGLGECVTRYIDLDARYRMKPSALATAIASDRRNGLKPWLVIASAGTTDTGAVDPLDALCTIARDNDLWYHIDAAYGGFFLLCDEGKQKLAGIDRADSIVMDPHKGLFLPYGSGAVLIRDRRKLQQAHYYQANYMQDASEASDEYSPADHSPELTRHFRGMRLWLPLKLFGLATFRACVEEKLLLARHFFAEIQRIDGFEVGPPPELSVVTYRYLPKRGDTNEFNRRLVRAVQEDGRVFISSTMLDDRFTLRIAALAFRTHLDTIETALEVLREKARILSDT